MSTQSADLHRSLLRPFIIHTLRGTGFHSTKPSVLDSLVDIAERHLLLLASSVAQQAQSAHNDPVPTITDVRHALTACSVLVPYADATEEEFRELMRRPLSDYAMMKGGHVRVAAERRRRDEQDTQDVREFTSWFDGPKYAEIRRVAGMSTDTSGPGNIGVGGRVVQTEDMLTVLKKKYGKSGQELDARFANTVLGQSGLDAPVVSIEGGNARSLREWLPKMAQTEEPVDEMDEDDAPLSTRLGGNAITT